MPDVHRTRRFPWFAPALLAPLGLLPLLLVGCPDGPSDEYEGDAAGECDDDADNDRDGAFDCEDPGCAGASNCAGDDDVAGDDDTGVDDAGGDDDLVDDDDSDDDDDVADDDDAAPGFDVCAGGGAPFAEIQPAIDAAADGDTILVCAGTYAPISVAGADLAIVGVEGATVTTIDGGSGLAVDVIASTLELSGFTLTGAADDGEAAALHATSATFTASALVVSGCTGDSSTAAAVLLEDSAVEWTDSTFEDNTNLPGMVEAIDGSDLVLRRSVIRENVYGLGAGANALVHVYEGDGEFSNLLVHDNTLNTGGGLLGGGPGNASGASLWIFNNTLWGNTNGAATDTPAIRPFGNGDVQNNVVADNGMGGILLLDGDTAAYNILWGNAGNTWSGAGTPDGTNIEANPRLVDPDNGDFTLDPGFSPCIDAGNPLSGYDDVDGTRNDLGAYGGPYGSWP